MAKKPHKGPGGCIYSIDDGEGTHRRQSSTLRAAKKRARTLARKIGAPVTVSQQCATLERKRRVPKKTPSTFQMARYLVDNDVPPLPGQSSWTAASAQQVKRAWKRTHTSPSTRTQQYVWWCDGQGRCETPARYRKRWG